MGRAVAAAPPPHLVALPCRAADPARQAFCDGFNEALLDRLARLTLAHRLQVARQIGGPSRQSFNRQRSAELQPAPPTSWIPSRMNTALSIRSTSRTGRRRILRFDTADVFDAEERAISWALRELAIEISPSNARTHRAVNSTTRCSLGLPRGSRIFSAREQSRGNRGRLSLVRQSDRGRSCVCAGLLRFRHGWLRDSSGSRRRPRQLRRWTRVGAAVQREPALSEGHTCLGMILSAQRKFEAAANEFARAVQLDKTNDEAIVGLGRAQEDLHLPADAERTYRAAIESRPGYFSPHVWAANFYRRQNRYDDAGRELESASRSCRTADRSMPHSPRPLMYTGRYDEALAAAEKAISIAPTREAMVGKGMTLFRMHRFEEAASAIEPALSWALLIQRC
jgi:tetratricopeptide (TPR) repeat protein